MYFKVQGGEIYSEPDYEEYREDPFLIQLVREYFPYNKERNSYGTFSIHNIHDDCTYEIIVDGCDTEHLVVCPTVKESVIKKLHTDSDKLLNYLKSIGITII